MDVIDRYLLAVKFFLPKAVQGDVIKELSEDIRAQVDERESELGRPLTPSEREQLIKNFGHPALLAGRYGPRRRLIGAEIFPFYWFVLKLALGVGILVHAVVTIGLLATGKWDLAIRQATVILPIVAFVQFGCITLVFAALDNYRGGAGVRDHWRPSHLPTFSRRTQPISQLICTVVAAVWLVLAWRFPSLLFGPAASIFGLAPVWQSIYIPTLVLIAADIAVQIFRLIRPQSTRPRALARVVIDGFSLVLLFVLFRAKEWVIVGSQFSDQTRRVADGINQYFPFGLAIVAAGLVVAILLEFRHLMQLDTDHVSARI